MKAVEPNRNERPGARPARSAWAGLALVVGMLVTVIAAAISPAWAATSAKSPARITFGIAPATAHGVSGLSQFSFGATAGGFAKAYFAVLNYSAKPLSLQVYATDAIDTSSGGFGLLPAGVKPTGVGAWVTLPSSAATVRVPAESSKAPGQVIIPFTVRVPDNATPGDHAGGIIASLRTKGHNANGQNIILEQRVGTRLFIRVAGVLAPKVTITDVHSTYHGAANPIGRGSVTVSYRISNTGNVDLALRQGVTVSGLFGAKRQLALPGVPLLLAGDSLIETARLSGVWPQLIDHAKVTATPTAPTGGVTSGLAPVTASASVVAIPWALLVLIVLILAGVAAGVKVRRRRQRPAVIAPAKAEPVGV